MADKENFTQVLQMELKYYHGADKVRQVLGILGFIRTPMMTGKKMGGFVIPLLDVESVSESIVDGVYNGYGNTIYMPSVMAGVASLVRPLRLVNKNY